jgi:anti-sigma factor RsiW
MAEQTTRAACAAIRQRFPDYVDGAVTGRVMSAVAAHLEECKECHSDFAAWQALQQAFAVAQPVRMPAGLNMRLRDAMSDENARRERWQPGNLAARCGAFLRPVLLRGAAGLVTATLLLGGIGWMVGEVGATPVLANDRPLGALTEPHFLYSLAPAQMTSSDQDAAVVVQAKVDDEGRVYDYRIVCGPQDAATEAQVRDRLMLLMYQPATAFGLPVRGQVMISFAGVSVKA